MSAHFRILEATLLSIALGASAPAQTEPPTLIRLVRSMSNLVTTGGLIQPYIDAKAPVTVLGLSSVSGAPETWLIEAHDSFASIEEVDMSVHPTASAPASAPGDLLPPSTTLIAVYRPDWSYRPAEAMTAPCGGILASETRSRSNDVSSRNGFVDSSSTTRSSPRQ